LIWLKAKGKIKKTPASYLWYIYKFKTFLGFIVTLITAYFIYGMYRKVLNVEKDDIEFYS